MSLPDHLPTLGSSGTLSELRGAPAEPVALPGAVRGEGIAAPAVAAVVE